MESKRQGYDELIIEKILSSIGWSKATVHSFQHGMFRSSLKLERPKGHVAVLRIHKERRKWETECIVLGALDSKGFFPKALDAGFEEGYWWHLMSYIPGVPLSECTNVSMEAYANIGQALAAIHEIQLPVYGKLFAGGMNLDEPLDWKTLMDARFVQEYTFANDNKTIPQDLLAKAGQLYKAFRPINPASPHPCLIHRDFLPDNIIVHDSGLEMMGVLDFENSQSGEAIWDFAKLTEYILEPFPGALVNVTQGYKSVRELPDLSTLPSYRLLTAMGAVQVGKRLNHQPLIVEGNRVIIDLCNKYL